MENERAIQAGLIHLTSSTIGALCGLLIKHGSTVSLWHKF
jgi:hypothetical protein